MISYNLDNFFDKEKDLKLIEAIIKVYACNKHGQKIRLIINIMGFLLFSGKEDLMGRQLKKRRVIKSF